ncbi:hypothetical protein Tco_0741846 [Tanacetum coccineum]
MVGNGSFAQMVVGRKVTNNTNQQQNNIGRDTPKAPEVKEDFVELSSGVPVRVWYKSSFRKILAKWGEVVVMKNELGKYILSNLVDVSTKDVVGLNPTFAIDTTPTESKEEVEIKDDIYDNDGNLPHYSDELLSSNLFGIYATMACMDKEEVLKKDDKIIEDAGEDVNQHIKGDLRQSTPDDGIVRLKHHGETILVGTRQ